MKRTARWNALAAALLAPAACSTAAPPDAESLDRSADAGPPRTLITRPLLPTSTRSLLLDPFVTSDRSWGHFVGALLPVKDQKLKILSPPRAFVSQTPAGVAAPIAIVPALAALEGGVTSLQIIAPFPGGAEPLDARIWVSAGDDDGKPLGADAVTRGLTVALLPNDRPSHTYPFVPDGAAPVVLAGRSWVRLALPAPAPLREGGWFPIAVTDPHLSLQLQAPEVTPAAGAGGGAVAVDGRTERDRTAVAAYAEIIQRGPGQSPAVEGAPEEVDRGPARRAGAQRRAPGAHRGP